MASQKRSFQCFEAIVDNYPHKPFPVGHRFGAPQKSSHSLEPLEDRGCYLCADHQQAKPMTTEASGSQSNSWYQPQTQQHQHAHRRPTRPDGEPVEGSAQHHHHHHRHSKRIVLVKNSDPSIQKTIVLHRRTVRSLGVFLDDVSELMQCLIRKLYTLEGRKIDSIQSLLQCPSILVCVGREPFHPLFLDSFRKNSDDKLPKLILKSRSSASNEEQGCKNVNFGFETKKSIIHPRMHSTDKSAKLTMSSEKSFPNGLNSQARENMMDEDIEKRVLVNKDGSLSMEMKVRFRLLNDETLHWSTEIKKSSSTFNESSMGYNDAYYLQHGNSDSCSEAESLSAGDADTAKLHQKHLEELHCQHCCTHCQEYDIWKNPVLGEQRPVRHIRSSSSSASSHKIVCKKMSVDSVHTMSSEEFTEQVVEKAACFQETVGEDGDTTVEYCTISRCCNHSEVCSLSPKKDYSEEKDGYVENTQEFMNNDKKTQSASTFSFIESKEDNVSENERPVSVERNSSQVLPYLKKDQDEEETGHLQGNSRASQCDNQEDNEENKYAASSAYSGTSCKSPVSSKQLSPMPPSNVAGGSVKSRSRHCQHSKVVAKAVVKEESNILKASIQPEEHVIHESDIKDIAVQQALRSSIISKPDSNFEDNTAEPAETNENKRSSSAMSNRSNASGKSGESKVNVATEQEHTDVKDNLEERSVSAMSSKSNISARSMQSRLSEVANKETMEAKVILEKRTQGAMSNTSLGSRQSTVSEVADDEFAEVEDQIEDRAPSGMSTVSVKSNSSRISESSEMKEGSNQIQDRSPSTLSVKSNASARSKKSRSLPKTIQSKEIESQQRVPSTMSTKSNASAASEKADSAEISDKELDDRVPSAMSAKSHHSSISETATAVTFENPKDQEAESAISHTSVVPITKNIVSDVDTKMDEAGGDSLPERAPSSRSVKSNSSARTTKSSASVAPADTGIKTDVLQERVSSVISSKSHVSDRSISVADESTDFEDKTEERALSALSTKSNISTKTNKSKISEYVSDIAGEEVSERSKSAMSSISNASTKSKNSVSVLTNEELVGLESQTCSGLSVKFNNSERSIKSKDSETINVNEFKEANERSSSAMTSKSNVSERSMKSNVSEWAHDDPEGTEAHTEQRAASAMSVNSNLSGKSKSKISKNVERTTSSLSTKSNKSAKSEVSVKSIKSKISDPASEEPEYVHEDQGKRAPSALSCRSNVSIRSNSSKVSESATGEPTVAEYHKEDKDPSTTSAKSNTSVQSKKLNPSEAAAMKTRKMNKGEKEGNAKSSKKSEKLKVQEAVVELPAEVGEQKGERAASVVSVKSNSSVKSKKSTVSNTQFENVYAETCQTGERSQSALSIRTNVSERSKTSEASEAPGQQLGDGEKGERALSAMPCKSIVSTASNKSKISDTVVFEFVEVDHDLEERVPSTTSAKYYISEKSKISETETKDEKAIEDTVADAISPCSLSARSNASPKSKTSKILETGPEDPKDENEGKSKRTSSAASPKVNISARSKQTESSEIVPDETADVEDQTAARTPSVLSTKSNTSTRSKKSRGSDINFTVKEVETVERSPSTMSANSNSSVISMKSKLSKVQPEQVALKDEQVKERLSSAISVTFGSSIKHEISSQTNNSAKSDPAKSEEADDIKTEERTMSPMSPKSNISSRSRKSKSPGITLEQTTKLEDFNERSASALSTGSVKSKKSQNSQRTGNGPAKKGNSDVGIPSVLSKTSAAFTNNNILDVEPNIERSITSTYVKSSSSAKSKESVASKIQTEGSVPMEEELNRAKTQMSAKSDATTISNKPTVEEEKENCRNPENTANSNVEMGGKRVKSALSDHLKASSSIKCVCGVLKKSQPTTKSSASKADDEERSASALSYKSAKSKTSSVSSNSERDLTPASASVSIGIVEEYDADNIEEECLSVASTTSVPNLKSKSGGTQTPHDRSSLSAESDVSNKSKMCECTHSISAQPKTKSDSLLMKQRSSTSGGQSSSNASSVSHSEVRNPSVTDRPNSNISHTSSHLEVKVQKSNNNSKCTNKESKRSNNPSNRSSKQDQEKTSRPRSADMFATSDNLLSPSPSKSPKKSRKPVILLGSSNDSVLSQSVSAPEPLNENLNTTGDASDRTNVSDRTCNCPLDVTEYGRNVSEKTSEKSSKCMNRKGSSSSQKKSNEEMTELVPSNLPNASPTEVVNEWLNKIPLDSALYDVGDEFHENCEELETLKTLQEPTQNEIGNGSEGDADVAVFKAQIETEAQLVNKEMDNDEDKEDSDGKITEDLVAPGINQSCPEKEAVSKSFHSSVQVMRVLLSPKLDRCNSLPEVSTVYGQKLSTSARGLLDCLVNLQLIDFDPSDVNGKAEKYKDLMNMLQSLWFCDSSDKMSVTLKSKSNDQQSMDYELKAKSSSGVDVSSGSTVSGKSSVNDSTQAQKSQTNTEGEGLETLAKLQEVDETGGEEALEVEEMKSDPATPDIARRVQWTPEAEVEGNLEERIKDSNNPASDDTIMSNDSPRDPLETPPSSNKSAVNDHQEDTSSGTPPSVQRAQLTKKFSQDPDPVWVLNLLSKLEKQFMTHYVNAMSEFKVRWNLDDNEQLDAMICELRDEVHKRIQSSIDRELKKIQGRAGRPKPPKEAISRESTVQTEQRRRRLKVMLNQSIDTAAKSDDDFTVTGTDFSDQRSDDEYCPCDTCMKKKMAMRPVLPVEILNSAPVMMDFDLRKILQLKREAPTNSKNYIIEETGNEEADGGTNAKGAEKNNYVTKKDIHNENKEMHSNLAAHEISYEKNKEIMENLLTTDSAKEQEAVDSETDKQDVNEAFIESKNDEQEHSRDVKTVHNETADQSETILDESVEAGKTDTVEEEDIAARVSTGTETAEAGEVEVEEDEEKIDELAERKGSVESETVGEVQPLEAKTTEEEVEVRVGQEEKTDKQSVDELVAEGEIGKDEATDAAVADFKSTKESKTHNNQIMEKNKDAEMETLLKREEEEASEKEVQETAETETIESPSAEVADEEEDTKCEESEEKESQKDETGEDEAPKEEKGETDEDESVKRKDTSMEEKTGEETVEDGVADEEKISKSAMGDESKKESKSVEYKIPKDGDTTKLEISKEEETAEEMAEDIETDKAETAAAEEEVDATKEDIHTGKDETAEDEETDDDEISENGRTTNDEPEGEDAHEAEIAETGMRPDGMIVDSVTDNDGTSVAEEMAAEEGEAKATADEETADDEKTVNGEVIKMESTEGGHTVDEETPEEGETADYETGHDREISKADIAEDLERTNKTRGDEKTFDNEKEEDGVTSNDGTAEDGEITDDGIADKNTCHSEAAEIEETDNAKTAENGNTTVDDQAELGENLEAEMAEDDEEADEDLMAREEIGEANMSEDVETADDRIAEDGESAEDETAKDEETAEDGTAEDKETADDETAEDGETEKAEVEKAEYEGTADGGTVEDGETADDGTAEDGVPADVGTTEDEEAADGETAEDEKTADDGTAEDGETADDGTVENGETADGRTAKDGETADDGTVKDGETADDGTAEDAETDDDGTAEDRETADDGTAEDEETADDVTAKDGETADDETAEDGETADDGMAEDAETADDGAGEDEETADDVIAKDGETAEDGTAEDDETADGGIAKDGETADGGIAEDGETADDGMAEDAETADDGAGEDAETADDGAGEDEETADDVIAKDGETAEDGTAEDDETADGGIAGDGETTDNGIAEDGETVGGETAEDGETTDDDTAEDDEAADGGKAEDGETADNRIEEDGETAGGRTWEDGETADGGTVEDGETANDGIPEDAETADDGTEEDGETADDETSQHGETSDNETAENTEIAIAETKNREAANEESLDNEETAGEVEGIYEETDESDNAEDNEEGKDEARVAGKDPTDGSVVNSTDDHDEVTELRAEDDADDENAPLKNEGDVVVYSIEENMSIEESKEEHTDNIQGQESSELMSDSQDQGYPGTLDKGYLNSHLVNIGESAEGGDEAEDETEPDVDTDEEGQKIMNSAGQPPVRSVHEDDQTDETTMASFDAVEKICTGSEDGADADVEDSETEVHIKYDNVDIKDDNDSVSIARKKIIIAYSPSENKESEGPAKLSDIAEDAAEDNEDNEKTTKQDKVMKATDCEEESAEDSLIRQITKSSMESQPGSLEEVLDEEMKSQKSSDHLTVKGNCMYPTTTSEEDSKDTQEKSDAESVDLQGRATTPKQAAKKSSKLKDNK